MELFSPYDQNPNSSELSELRAAELAKVAPNDNAPELGPEGVPTAAQTAKEFVWIFDQSLKGFGVGMALRRFHWKIYQLTKPGKEYFLNDGRLIEAYGGVGRAHICHLRKKLKAWNNGEYDSGVRHFAYIAVKDSYYNPGTKEQIATAYEFSESFHNFLTHVHSELRSNRFYQVDWYKAAREVLQRECAAFKDHSFGYWEERRERKPRSAADVFGTHILNLKRVVRTIASSGSVIGVPELYEKINSIVKETFEEAAKYSISLADYHGDFRDPLQAGKIYKTGDMGKDKKPFDGQLFWEKVIRYVEQREAEKFKDNAAVYVRPQRKAEAKANNDRNPTQWTSTNIGSERDDINRPGLSEHPNLVTRRPDELGGTLPAKTAMDNARLRFLAGSKNGGGKRKE